MTSANMIQQRLPELQACVNARCTGRHPVRNLPDRFGHNAAVTGGAMP